MITNIRFLLVGLLLILAALFINLHADITVPMNRPFSEFPSSIGFWEEIYKFRMDESSLRVLKAADYLYRKYAGKDGSEINLYVGYHSGGRNSGGIHSPKHCLPGSGWFEISESKAVFEAAGSKINYVRAVYQKGEAKELFLYWYEVKGKSLNDEYSLKMAEIAGSILNRRRDSAFIRISVPFEINEEKANAAALDFIRAFYPVIREFLPG